MGSELTKTVASWIAERLWAELAGLGELWLRLIAWLVAENGRLLAPLEHSIALLLILPLYVLAVLVVGRGLGLLSPRGQRPIGGMR
ncbi:MAG TPA: hypothetical protein VII83_06355 [Gaiellaceae bacterium]